MQVSAAGRRDRHRAHALHCAQPSAVPVAAMAAAAAPAWDVAGSPRAALTLFAAPRSALAPTGSRSTDRRRPGRGPRSAAWWQRMASPLAHASAT
jgi:hypothetical protein